MVTVSDVTERWKLGMKRDDKWKSAVGILALGFLF